MKKNKSYVICEVDGGVLQDSFNINCSSELILVDWDNIRVDREYALQVIDELEKVKNLDERIPEMIKDIKEKIVEE